NNIRHLRQFLKGWAKHVNVIYKVEKDKLLHLINELDLKAESTFLDADDRASKMEVEQRLRELLREE
uniref:Uncharacterized protein n=1 Tax=Aegilops tauschii subsp. strangulata TaxID=200361 RepID=A0A452YGE7_AEGTS